MMLHDIRLHRIELGRQKSNGDDKGDQGQGYCTEPTAVIVHFEVSRGW